MWSLNPEEPKASTTSKDTSSLGRNRGQFFNASYRSAFCLSVLLVQLARVHSWSPSSIAKTFKPSTSNRLAHRDADALFWASFAERPTIPSSELLSSRYLVQDPSKTNHPNNNLLMVASGSPPSMLLKDDFFFPVSTRSLATSDCVRRGVDQGNSLMQSSEAAQNDREGRVLGFDVFALHSTKHPESPSASSGEEEYPGMTWQNSPLPNTVSDNLAASASSLAAIKGRSSNNNGGVRLLKYDDSSLLPAWFPWIPTKSQIMTLKVKELKEACSQRGLTKTGNKDVLQERLFEWTKEHQMQHQARLSGDFLTGWFENDDENDPNSFLRERERQRNSGEFIDATNDNDTPNSLAEWTRTIDPEKLTQKRQEIHRQKRMGKKPNSFDASLSPNNKKFNKKKNSEDPAATKEYLTKLANAMKTSPSSPYASNKDVKELYDASKKADQLGEPLLAIELLESLLKLTPNDARIYRRLSRMHNDQGNLDLARATLQNGLRKLPSNPWLWHGMGQLEMSQGRTDYGIRCYQRAIQEDPAFAHSYHAWGIHEFNNGQIAKSMKILKKGIEYCPTNHRLHHALGDLYRGAKLLKDAERSYMRALEEGPRVSHSFALSALASVSYELGNVDEARRWLYRSIEMNNGRHAQGWLALAEIEEAEGNVGEALKICEAAIIRYEHGLMEARKRYKSGSKQKPSANGNKHPYHKRSAKPTREQADLDKSFLDISSLKEVDRSMLKSIPPKYRSGDKFLSVYRHWAHLEGRYGTYDSCNRIYKRASTAFPLEYKIHLDWARYHANIRSRRARDHFVEACSRAATTDAEPYREYAAFEMSLGEYEQARKILFRGAQAVARSPDGGTGKRNQLELARLYVAWAVCEWHLQNIPRVEVLFDHALRLTEIGSDEGSELRTFVLFCLAQLEYYERDELHLAQNYIGLCLKENALPGGNAPIWNLWAKIARGLENSHLEEECLNEAKRCKMELEDLQEEEDEEGSSALDTMNMLKGSENIQNMMRQKPWFENLQAARASLEHESDESSTLSSATATKFYGSIRLPNFDNHEFRKQPTTEEKPIETQQEEVAR